MLTLSSPLDMHVHLRQDAMLRFTAPYTARDFAAAVIMPNLWSNFFALFLILFEKTSAALSKGTLSFALYHEVQGSVQAWLNGILDQGN